MKKILFLLLILSTTSLVGQNIDSGLVLYYQFDNDTKDASGNGYDIKYYPNYQKYTDGRWGKPNTAYYFNGDNNYLVLNLFKKNFTAYSISAWIYAINQGSDESVITMVTDNSSYGIYSSNAITCKGQSESKYIYYSCIHKNANPSDFIKIKSSVPYYGGMKWMHIVTTWDGDSLKLYVNNDLIETKIANSIGNLIGELVIGATNFGGMYTSDTRFKGKMDYLRVYNRSITPIEIDLLYHEGDTTQVIDTTPDFINQKNNEIINISPNPVESYFKINISGKLNIYDLQGKLIFSEFLLNDSNIVNIEHLNYGIYYGVILNNNRFYSFKLFKQ